MAITQVMSFSAREFNFYLGEDWSICNALRANIGTDFSIYNITGKSHLNLTPASITEI